MGEALAERLTGIISGADSEINLPEAALLVASHRYPDLDVQHYLGALDTLGETLRQRIDPSASEPERIVALNQFLFGDLGFAPNADDYYDPRNSLLNEVIDRRVGIPITLSLVYMEVGKRVGLPLQGVCFPGHFLVKCKVSDGLAILDPYSGGTSLGIVDLQRRLREVRGGEVSRAIIAGLLVGSSNKEILLRVLRNLKAIYLRSHQLEHALAVMEWIVRAAPDQAVEVRDRGMVYQELDCFRAAIADFDLYLELDPGCTDADDIRLRRIRLQQAAARLN
ncbi:MAG TPA: tetratricopeptide repeat protein [Burkholderiales bacterium]|nr:tetratricopeptide repeat protein [Burkholderiales bacterium]